MRVFGSSLCLGLAILSTRPALAAPVTLQLEGPRDSLCIVADYDRDPAIPHPEGVDWTFGERDSAWQSTENGIVTNDVRYTQNFQAELEGVQGNGWVNLYYSHFDFPHSSMYSYDAELMFTFRKGDRMLDFTARGALFEPYAGTGAMPDWGGGAIGVGGGFDANRQRNGMSTEDQRTYYIITRITEGVAECPGKERAWKFKVKSSTKDPNCGD